MDLRMSYLVMLMPAVGFRCHFLFGVKIIQHSRIPGLKVAGSCTARTSMLATDIAKRHSAKCCSRLGESFPFVLLNLGYQSLTRYRHGLSCTSFEFSDVVVSDDSVKLTVTNTGERSGSETVQIYIAPPEAARTPLAIEIDRPVKELRGFAKVHLDPGSSTTVTIKLDKFAGAFWDENDLCWVVSARTYRLLIGKSSRDIAMERQWTVKETRRWTGL